MNLESAEARRRLEAARVAHLATVGEDGRPQVVPVAFATWDDTIAVAIDHKPKRTTDLQRLRNIRANPHVSVLADHYEERWESLWWVRADGRASIVEEPDGRAEPIRRLCAKYPQYRERVPEGPVIAITVTRWSGWAHSAAPSA
jgi:PPOX class probable F420-dependent enzyme